MSLKEINFKLKVKMWKNGDGVWLIDCPRYKMTSYGKTRKEAVDMLLYQIDDIIKSTNPK